MNFSFFKRWASQPTSLSSAAVARAVASGVAAAAHPAPQGGPVEGADECLEMPLDVILPLLPASTVRPGAGHESGRAVRLPLKQILPQLAKGRVVVSLGEVLGQLPAEMLASPGAPASAEKLSLPLEQVVANLSPEALQPRNDQKKIELDESEIPSPFAEETIRANFVEPPAPLRVQAPPEESAEPFSAERVPLAEPLPEAADPVDAPVEEPELPRPLFEPPALRDVAPDGQTTVEPAPSAAPAPPDDWRKQWVYVPLGDILDATPSAALTADRELVRANVDVTYKVPLPMEEVVAQLPRGRITLDLSKLAGKLPEGILNPSAAGPISIRVESVITQLPESVFAPPGGSAATAEEVETIPMPFQETPRSEQPLAPVEDRVEPHPQEAPVVAPEPEPVAEPIIPEQLFPPVAAQPPVETPVAEAPAAPELVPPPVEPIEPEATAEADDLDSIAASSLAETTEPPATAPARTLTPEQIAQALSDLNAWTADDLHRHSLGPTLAQRLLDYRAQRGPFKDLRELLQVAGIGPRLFERVLGFRPEALEDQSHAINRLLGVPCDHEMSLQEIVKCASRLPGIEGCLVAMSDGLHMTGELPGQMDSQRVSAFAPQLFARVAQYVQELNVGAARRLTIFTDAQPITIFKADDLFFIVIHKANRFSKVLLNRCERISQEISRICSQETPRR
jgi:predicted regulator of Ras-like GTPase activity (Roadblock/LC7/MglB family)